MSRECTDNYQAGGAFNFALCMPVWVIFIAQITDAVDFPFPIPVGDFSTLIPGRSQRMQTGEV